jgi:hypothetical protein
VKLGLSYGGKNTLCRLRKFKKRALRSIFGPKRNNVIGGWRKLLNEEHHNLYFLPNKNDQIKEDEMGGTCSTNGEEEWILDFGGKARRKETTRKTWT